MEKILTVIALMTTLFITPFNAQDVHTFSSKVDDHIKNKHPDWRSLMKQIDGTDISNVWFVEEKKALQCLIGYTASEQAAKREYDNYNHGFSVGPTAQLKNLGDEAVFYQSNGSEACTIIFRKSNVAVLLMGGPCVVSKGLAQEIAELIANK